VTAKTAGDRQAVRHDLEMLEHSYSFAIEDLEDEGPQPVEDERLRARQPPLTDVLAGRSRQQCPLARISQASVPTDPGVQFAARSSRFGKAVQWGRQSQVSSAVENPAALHRAVAELRTRSNALDVEAGHG